MDNYYSHKDPDFQKIMRGGNSLIDYLPADTTDLIQTNDRGLGKLWKDKMTEKIDEHLEQNWDVWFGSGVNASERRILRTQFAGEAGRNFAQVKTLLRALLELAGCSSNQIIAI